MRRLMMVLAMLGSAMSQAAAQNPFVPGHVDFGPTIGVGGIGSAGLAFGGRLERGVKTLPDFGDGVVGIELSLDYYQFNSGFSDLTFRFAPIGGTANYHFKVKSENWDPFLGLGLGYAIASASSGGETSTAATGLYFIGRAGARFFFKPTRALYLDLGSGAATANFGLMFSAGAGK